MGGSSSKAESTTESKTTIEQTLEQTDNSWSYTDNSKRFIDQSIVDNSKQYFDDSVLDQSQRSISEIVTDSNIKNHVYIDQTQRAVSDAEVLAIGSGNYLRSVHEFDFRGTREGNAIVESNPLFGDITGGVTESSYVSNQSLGFGETGVEKGEIGFGYTGSELIKRQEAGQLASPETRQTATSVSQAASGILSGMGMGIGAGASGIAGSIISIIIVLVILGALGFGIFMLMKAGKRRGRGTTTHTGTR